MEKHVKRKKTSSGHFKPPYMGFDPDNWPFDTPQPKRKTRPLMEDNEIKQFYEKRRK
jgi:hypothetical protein